MMTPKKPDPVDVEVGQRIRIQRLQSGLSQTSLAEQLGVTFQQGQKYEKGVNRVGAGRLTKIAKVLGVPVSSRGSVLTDSASATPVTVDGTGTISGTVDLTSSTLHDPGGVPLTCTDLDVGARLDVDGIFVSDGTIANADLTRR